MAKKSVSDTIAQQRKAREEFLELKKMQHGEIQAPPKPSEMAVEPKTFSEKLSRNKARNSKRKHLPWGPRPLTEEKI